MKSTYRTPDAARLVHHLTNGTGLLNTGTAENPKLVGLVRGTGLRRIVEGFVAPDPKLPESDTDLARVLRAADRRARRAAKRKNRGGA